MILPNENLKSSVLCDVRPTQLNAAFLFISHCFRFSSSPAAFFFGFVCESEPGTMFGQSHGCVYVYQKQKGGLLKQKIRIKINKKKNNSQAHHSCRMMNPFAPHVTRRMLSPAWCSFCIEMVLLYKVYLQPSST